MDNVTHAMAGWALARLLPEEDRRPWVVPCAILAANLPDLEILIVWPVDKPFYLLQHRGWSHSLIGVLLEVLALTVLVWGLGRWLAKRKQLAAAIPWRPLFLLNSLAAASHLFLDWWNTYGIRPLYPFDPRWMYGDFVFIIDPWVWLILGGTLLLGSRFGDAAPWLQRTQWLFWGTFGLLILGMTWSGYLSGLVPVGLPLIATAALAGLAWVKWHQKQPPATDIITWSGVALLSIYVATLFGFSRQALEVGQRAFQDSHYAADPINQSVNPYPGIPWRFEVVQETSTEISQYSVNAWSGKTLRESRRSKQLDLPELGRLEDTRELRAWRSFARHPVVERDGDYLILGDARYQLFPGRDDWSAQRVRVK